MNDHSVATATRRPGATPPRAQQEPDWARSATYLPRARVLRVELRSGVCVEVPVRLIQVIAKATPKQRAALELAEDGYAIWWPLLDEGVTVPNLVAGTLGSRVWMRALGRLGGSARSPRKTAAARANGRKGGRPRKAATSRAR